MIHVLLFMISARRNDDKMVDRNVTHCVFKCHFTTPPSLHSLTMSSNMAASASAYVCHNPHCTSRRTSFASEKAFTMHCQQSPSCLVFIRDEVRGSATSSTTSHAASVNNPIMTSTKRASILRCEVINKQYVGDDTTMDFLIQSGYQPC